MSVIESAASSSVESPEPKLRGGRKQRKRRRIHRDAASGSLGNTQLSKTASYLSTQFAWGEFSPQEVQRLATLVAADIKVAIAGKAA